MRSEIPYRIATWLTILFPLTLLAGSAVQDATMSVIAILFLSHCVLEKDWRWCDEPWVRCLILLWLYMVSRGVVADSGLYLSDHAEYLRNPFQATRRTLPFVRYFAFSAALSYWMLRDPVIRRRFFRVLSGVAIGLAADCLLQWFLGADLLGRSVTESEGRLRLTGPFRSPMPGILLAWIYFPACLPLLVGERGLRSQWRLPAAAAVCLFVLVALALTGERMALILTLAGWGLAILLLSTMRRALTALLIGGLLLLALATAISPKVVGRQMNAMRGTLMHLEESPYGLLLKSDLRLAAQSPVFGKGTNYFRLECPKLYSGRDERYLASVCNVHPHNIYLEWLIENGVIGLGLFVTFIVCTYKICVPNWNKLHSDPCFIGGLIAFTLRAWPFASTTSFFSPWGAPPFWMAVAIVVACRQPRLKSEDEQPAWIKS